MVYSYSFSHAADGRPAALPLSANSKFRLQSSESSEIQREAVEARTLSALFGDAATIDELKNYASALEKMAAEAKAFVMARRDRESRNPRGRHVTRVLPLAPPIRGHIRNGTDR